MVRQQYAQVQSPEQQTPAPKQGPTLAPVSIEAREQAPVAPVTPISGSPYTATRSPLAVLTDAESNAINEALAGYRLMGWLGMTLVGASHLRDPNIATPERHLRDYPSAEAFMEAIEANSQAIATAAGATEPPRGTMVLRTGCVPDVDALVRWAESAGDASYNLTVLVQAGMQALDEVCQRKVAAEVDPPIRL
tara:strand:+ start:5587 stop:6165 length:579 start_codon:yes stop_codon:yes gene_type:complete